VKVLICPDKFKGTLTAHEAAEAISVGWRKYRPHDSITLRPVSDGGDGFGAIMADMVRAREVSIQTVNAAQQSLTASYWWETQSKLAIVEAASIVGLAMLPKKRFHPFDLNTFGLGKALVAAARKGAKKALVGIGGSATNDGGFGMARALGWKFINREGVEIIEWLDLKQLQSVVPPKKRKIIPSITVAVDVNNPLLGAKGCSRVFGPQKGLSAGDMKPAEAALRRLAVVLRNQLGLGDIRQPGVGAAGGLGFGLSVFVGAKLKPGFDLVARHARLKKLIRSSDLVITGEGAIDHQTLMGKGTGEIAVLAAQAGVPCVGLGGMVEDKRKSNRLFADTGALVDLTSTGSAMKNPTKWLANLAASKAQTLAA
jgi:glycerate kinase